MDGSVGSRYSLHEFAKDVTSSFCRMLERGPDAGAAATYDRCAGADMMIHLMLLFLYL